jgi:hypothetical protein
MATTPSTWTIDPERGAIRLFSLCFVRFRTRPKFRH